MTIMFISMTTINTNDNDIIVIITKIIITTTIIVISITIFISGVQSFAQNSHFPVKATTRGLGTDLRYYEPTANATFRVVWQLEWKTYIYIYTIILYHIISYYIILYCIKGAPGLLHQEPHRAQHRAVPDPRGKERAHRAGGGHHAHGGGRVLRHRDLREHGERVRHAKPLFLCICSRWFRVLFAFRRAFHARRPSRDWLDDAS